MAFLDTLNGNNLLNVYKLIIQTGTQEFLTFPERKDSLSNDWREENGTETDLELVRFKEKEVSLNCIFIVDDDTQFWNCYNAFFAEIAKSGTQNLFINDHSKTYQVFYKKSSGFQNKTKRLKNVPKVAVKFTITLGVKL